MQTVLVAGGAGFIGSHLCKNLLETNYKVICVDNLLTGDKKNIRGLLRNSRFKFVDHDITRPISSILNSLTSFRRSGQFSILNFIFHLASPASPNRKSPRSYLNHPIETLLANSLGTYNLLELARQSKTYFLYASSSKVYGDPAISPQKEDYFGNVNPNGIRSVYDEGKRFGEAITFSYVRKYNLNARVVRIFNTYGPMMQVDDGRVVPNFINQTIRNKPITVYGNGTQARSFCYVDDMVLGIKDAMFLGNTKGQVFNLGNPDERTILNIATLIKNMTNSSSKIIFEDIPNDDPRERKPDIGKAKKILGWEPKVATEDGLQKTIEYFRSIS